MVIWDLNNKKQYNDIQYLWIYIYVYIYSGDKDPLVTH